MTSTEVKNEMEKILEELKILQSIGTYNRPQIEALVLRRRELQELCPHENSYKLNFDGDSVTICHDCGKILN